MTRVLAAGLLGVVAAAGLLAQPIAQAELEIRGSGLRVVETAVTTGIDFPTTIQTEFGGEINDEAPFVAGLLAEAELTGPGLDAPLTLTTEPGHRFRIPGLRSEGVYLLQNIRLVKDGAFLQSAIPSIATITVADVLQTTVRVRQLTAEELRARGINLDARFYDVYEYTFSFFVDGELVEVSFPVVIDPATRVATPIDSESPYTLPPDREGAPPRWTPPSTTPFEFVGEEEMALPPPNPLPGDAPRPRPRIPAAIVIPNDIAVLHQFFSVALMVSNGAPDGSAIRLDSIGATIRTPAELRVNESTPRVSFGSPVPIVDASNGVTFLVAQASGEAEWILEGLRPGTHTIEFDLRATYKAPAQPPVAMRAAPRASIIVHDPRFNITFSHPDTVRAGNPYSTYSFITNFSPASQSIRIASGLPSCLENPSANVCREASTPPTHELTLAPGEMRSIEYRLRSNLTGSIFATAGSVEGDVVTAAVELHMGVSESGIPLSPATLVLPHYAQFLDSELVSAHLQLLGLGYSIATAPLNQTTAKFPRVIRTDVFGRAVDLARAGQHSFIGADESDALATLALDLLGNSSPLEEWDELRRLERAGRTAAAALARRIEATGTTHAALLDRIAMQSAHRAPFLAAAVSGAATDERPYALAVRGVSSNRRLEVPAEAAEGWVRELAWGELNRLELGGLTGEIAFAGRWSENLEVIVTPANDGPFTLDLVWPGAQPGVVLRASIAIEGVEGEPARVALAAGDPEARAISSSGAIVALATATEGFAPPLAVIAARQDLHLDPTGRKISLLFNRPIAPDPDLRSRFEGEIVFDRDGVNWQGPRPISSAALQADGRVVNLGFDHILSTNAAYAITIDPVGDPLDGTFSSIAGPVTPVIDLDIPAGIVYGRVLRADNSPVGGAEVSLAIYSQRSKPYPESTQIADAREDGSFLFESVARDPSRGYDGAYTLRAVDAAGKGTSLSASIRLPGRVQFVNLVYLGRGSAEGVVRYDDGTRVEGARVVAGSTMFDQFRSAVTDEDGFYRITDLPVGPLTFSAIDSAGNVTYAAVELRTAGEVLARDLTIQRRSAPGIGTVRGLVRRSDSGEPVAAARVGVFSEGHAVGEIFTGNDGRFELEGVPAGFVTLLAAEWSVSRTAAAIDFDLAPDSTREVTLTLEVHPPDQLVAVEGTVRREDPLHPGDPAHFAPVAGALVRIEGVGTATADASGRFLFESVPASWSGRQIHAWDPESGRSTSSQLPTLQPGSNSVALLIRATGGEGTIRVKLLDARGLPVNGWRVILPGFPPTLFTGLGDGVYELTGVRVGVAERVFAVPPDAASGDQFVSGTARVAFGGHVAPLTLRLPGEGRVRVSLASDIALIGDVTISWRVWDEIDQSIGQREVTRSTSENGVAGHATFDRVPALEGFEVSAAHPVHGHASASGRLAFDGDLATIELRLDRLATVRGTVYEIDGRTPVPAASVRLHDGRQDQGVALTASDGTFEFRNLSPSTSFQVIASVTRDAIFRTGFASARTPADGGTLENVPVILRRRGTVEGRVVNRSYKVFDPLNPANNVADDTPEDPSDNAPVPLAKLWLRELGFPARSFGSPTTPLTADAEGRFELGNVFEGALRASAWDAQNQELRGDWSGRLTEEGERVEAYVAIGGDGVGSIEALVLDPNEANEPVVNAEVLLLRRSASSWVAFDAASSDGAGRAAFHQLPAGDYQVQAYSKAFGRSGSSGTVAVEADEATEARILLEFSGRVLGEVVDPELGGAGVAGSHVTLEAFAYETRTTTEPDGSFLFDGVREGNFDLRARDPFSNRIAEASRTLSQADPEPFVTLELERTETLHLSVALPADDGSDSGTLAPDFAVDVRQRCVTVEFFPRCDFIRSTQGSNPVEVPGMFLEGTYKLAIREIGGSGRTLSFSGAFPNGDAANPLRFVLPAFGSVRVQVMQGGLPASGARVSATSHGRTIEANSDPVGFATLPGLRLGNVSMQVRSLDGAFTGSGSVALASQSTPAEIAIELGAFAGVAGVVEAESGGASVATRVAASFSGRALDVLTDGDGRYLFQGIPTSQSGNRVDLTYFGPDGLTIGAVQSVHVFNSDASSVREAPAVRLDATPPRLVTFTPPDGGAEVSPDTVVRFTFSEPLRASQITRSFFSLIPAGSSSSLLTTFTSESNPDGTFTVTMIPPAPPAGQDFRLRSNTLYRVIVSANLQDATGNALGIARGASFTTTDYAEPRILRTEPPVTLPLQANSSVRFIFNEPIDGEGWSVSVGQPPSAARETEAVHVGQPPSAARENAANQRVGGFGRAGQPRAAAPHNEGQPRAAAPHMPHGTSAASILFEKIAAPGGAVVGTLSGDVFVDPASSDTLVFSPAEPIEEESFYRFTVRGARDLEGNVAPDQTFELFSFDATSPFVILTSPAGGAPLVSGVEYTIVPAVRNGSATGTPATDVQQVEYFRVEGAAESFVFQAAIAPWSYRFVAPEAPAGGTTVTIRARATDLSLNESDPADLVLEVRPNEPPSEILLAIEPAAFHPSNRIEALVSFEDEGIVATAEVSLEGVRADDSPYAATKTKQVKRTTTADLWPATRIAFDLPANLKGGSKLGATLRVTDVRGLSATTSIEADVLADASPPEVLELTPAPETRFEHGESYLVEMTVRDLETGIAEVVFEVEGQTIRKTAHARTGAFPQSFVFSSGSIAVSPKNVDTRIPIEVTAIDNQGNEARATVEVIYAGVYDPALPVGAWSCPADRAAYPAEETVSIPLRVVASDDIAVTGVDFEISGVGGAIEATRVGVSDAWEAVATIAMPAAGESLTVVAVIHDADPLHEVRLPIRLDAVAIDITIDDRVQAILESDRSTYEGKSIMVRGPNARLVPHVAISFGNLLLLDGAKVETLGSTTSVERKLDLGIDGVLYADCASSIDVSDKGYLGGWALNPDGSSTRNDDARGRTERNRIEGGASSRASGSHAGLGGLGAGIETNAAYGSIREPLSLGSGGGGAASCCTAGGAGGGAIAIRGSDAPEALSRFVIAGSVKADGVAGSGAPGAGSGGSVLLDAKQIVLSGAARITAIGGDDDARNNGSAGGGGGRIAISASERLDVSESMVEVTARGGRNNGSNGSATHLDGGAGTIFLRTPGSVDGTLRVSSFDERFPSTAHQTRPTIVAGGSLTFDALTAGARTLVRIDDPIVVGGVADANSAMSIDPGAVVLLPGEVPLFTLTTTPAAGAPLIRAGSLAAGYEASSAAGVGTVRLELSVAPAPRVDSTFAYPLSVAPADVMLAIPHDAALGEASLRVVVEDRAGRIAQSEPAFFTIVDNTPVQITRFDATPLAFHPGGTASVVVDAADDLAIESLTFIANLGGVEIENEIRTLGVAAVEGEVFEVAVPVTTPGGQDLVVRILATDGFPDRAPTERSSTIAILADSAAPEIAILEPAADALFEEGTGNTIAIRARIADADVAVKEAFASIEGGERLAMTRIGSTDEYAVSLPVPAVEGSAIVSREIHVEASDFGGNGAISAVTVRIEPFLSPNAPVIAWTCSSSGAMYPAGYAAKLRVHALGNATGDAANGVQSVEMGYVDPVTSGEVILAGASIGSNLWEATMTIPAAPDGTAIAVRAVVRNVAGLENDLTSTISVVEGVRITANLAIPAGSATYEGETLIIEGGTTTIDGDHAFERLIVLGGARIAQTSGAITRLTAGPTFLACGATLDIAGGVEGGSILLEGTATHPAGRETGLRLSAGDRLDIPGTIDLRLKGYGARKSYPGESVPTGSAGGSHLGRGGINGTQGTSGSTYGSVTRPRELGGGESSVFGGGRVEIDTPELDLRGSIDAGGSSGGGGSAGGSVWIRAARITGDGSINAAGASSVNGRGGGGAIAIEYDDTISSGAWQTSLSARGQGGTGSNTRHSGAGTIWIRGSGSLYGDLMIDNHGVGAGQATELPSLGRGFAMAGSGGSLLVTDRAAPIPGYFAGHWVEIRAADGEVKGIWRIAEGSIADRSVTLEPNGSETIAIEEGDRWRGVYRFDSVAIAGEEKLLSPDRILEGAAGIPTLFGTTKVDDFIEYTETISEDVLRIVGRVSVPRIEAGVVTIEPGAVLTHPVGSGLTLEVSGTLQVLGTIDVRHRGYGSRLSYPGESVPTGSAGGSHLGRGGINGTQGISGSTYGSVTRPRELGGGEASVFGGGRVEIETPELDLRGSIDASGSSGGGGSAGGSVWIRAARITGDGSVSAAGATSVNGRGGGGAIAIEYGDTISSGAWRTSLSARGQGGTGSNIRHSGAGTIWIRGSEAVHGDLTVDNQGVGAGQATDLPRLGYGFALGGSDGALLVTDRATAIPGYFAGHRVEIRGAEGEVKGVWRIAAGSIADRTVTLEPDGDEMIAIEEGDGWQGIYRFDSVRVLSGHLLSADPVQAGSIELGPQGVLLSNDDRAPDVEMQLIGLESSGEGPRVTGAPGAVTDAHHPVTLIAENGASGALFTTTVNADGSFSVLVSGQAGDEIRLRARDGFPHPASSREYSAGVLDEELVKISPVVQTGLISIASDGNGLAVVTGAAGAITGAGALTLDLVNGATGAIAAEIVVDAGGGFIGAVAGEAAHPILVRAISSNGRTTGPVALGEVPFSTRRTLIPIRTVPANGGFLTRGLASEGTTLVVRPRGGADEISIFDISVPEAPALRRVVVGGQTEIYDLEIRDSWGFVASSDFATIDLASPTSAFQRVIRGGGELSVAVSGTRAFTSTNNNNGQIRIYDITNPAAPLFVREENTVSGIEYRDLIAYGDNYLIATTFDQTSSGTVGHDVVVIDRTNLDDLVVVADLDIPEIDVFRGEIVGSKLYVGSFLGGGGAVVDLADPSNPVVETIVPTDKPARRMIPIGDLAILPEDLDGIAFFDLTAAGSPVPLGKEGIGGIAWDVHLRRGVLYAANELGLVVMENVDTPPRVDRAEITMSAISGGSVTVSGGSYAIAGRGALTVEVRNETAGTSVGGIAVAVDGSFAAAISAASGDAISIVVTDTRARSSGVIPIGIVAP